MVRRQVTAQNDLSSSTPVYITHPPTNKQTTNKPLSFLSTYYLYVRAYLHFHSPPATGNWSISSSIPELVTTTTNLHTYQDPHPSCTYVIIVPGCGQLIRIELDTRASHYYYSPTYIPRPSSFLYLRYHNSRLWAIDPYRAQYLSWWRFHRLKVLLAYIPGPSISVHTYLHYHSSRLWAIDPYRAQYQCWSRYHKPRSHVRSQASGNWGRCCWRKHCPPHSPR